MIKTLIILAVVIVVVIIFYNLPKSKTTATSSTTPTSCPSSFAIHSGIGGLEVTTYMQQNGKYYSQISAGIGGLSGTLPQKEIQQADFLTACKQYQNPNSTSTGLN